MAITRYYSSTAAKTTLSSAVDSSTTSTNFSLAAATGLPSQYPFTLIIEKDTANEEIVTVTGKVGNSYTVIRGEDGSTSKSHSIGATVEHGVSARDFAESRSHEDATTAHGVTGSVVGTGGAQTLTGKTLTTATLGSDLAAGGYKITGLATPTSSSDAATKAYIDTQTASAAASASSAAISASSAATSASSALTSQGSAAVSASSAATSATAAATSAASAATSATAAATSAASALASQTAAATSATSALASQTAAATSATSALASQTAAATSATSAAASATAAATSATSAANSATTAAASVATIAGYATSASNSASAAATSATSAAASATAAATSATSAAASATAAATSATSAAASATSAANSAATATTSASQAATSASSAATSASSAATSASSAATSASSAAATYDLFDDRYLGAKATPPTVDNDGDPLTEGVIYYNSTDKNMYVWNSGTSSWQVFTTTGDITAVVAGTGLTGGATTGSATLNLDTSSVYVLPSQSTANGKYLQSDGTSATWQTIQAGSQVKIDSGAGSTYTYIDFVGMGTDTGTAGTVKVQPLTNTGANAGKRIYTGSTTPSSPVAGDLWVDTTVDTTPDLTNMVIMGAY
jgi:hypothetical protein